MFWKRNKPPYPRFYRYGNIFAKVTGPNAYIKSFVSSGVYSETLNETLETTDKLFQGWKEITEKKWLQHIDLRNARSTGKNEKTIKFAFEVGGRQYFTFENHFDFPAGRFRDMDIINTEHDARMTFEEIKKSFRKIVDYIDDKAGVKITAIASEAKMSLARIDLTYDFSLWEKLASAFYFEDSEDISTYDPGFNQQKIEHWRANFADFFLKISNEPARRLIPFSGNSVEDFQNFLNQMKAKKLLIEAGLVNSASDTSTQ